MSPLELTGRTPSHVQPSPHHPAIRMHPRAAAVFGELQRAAAVDGIQMEAVSAFRDFDRQAAIWNAKWTGKRPLLDRSGHPLDPAALNPVELAHAILVWSALPGASRHHWGSDFDVIDSAAVPSGYASRLHPDEYAANGPFSRLHLWLEENMGRFGFFFPYRTDRGGVSPEPWHISFAPVAVPALDRLTPGLVEESLGTGEIAGIETIRPRLVEIFERYVTNIDPVPGS